MCCLLALLLLEAGRYVSTAAISGALQMAPVLDHRGAGDADEGDADSARRSWQAAAETFERPGRPGAEAVRAKLSR